MNATRSGAARAWLGAGEVLGFTLLFLAAYWLLGPRVREPAVAVALALLLVAAGGYVTWFSPVRIHGDSLGGRGLGSPRTLFVRVDNLGEACWRYGVLAAVVATGVTGVSLIRDPGALGRVDWMGFGLKFVCYTSWALLQDLLFLAFFLARLRGIFVGVGEPQHATPGTRAGVSLLVAALFSVYHAPNVPMMGLGFALSTAMAWLYWATPNLPAAVLCHAVVGTVLSRIGNVPMRGGPFHDRPDLYISRAFFPWLGDWVGPYW